MTLPVTPRALIGAVRAESDPAKILAQINAAVTDMRSNTDARIEAIEAALNSSLEAQAGRALGGVGGTVGPVDSEYTSAFASYFRTGRDEEAVRLANNSGDRAKINAALTEGTDSQGGYLAPVEWDRQIRQKLTVISPMRRLAQVQTTSVGAFSTVWSDDSWGSGWVGETAARPSTTTAGLSTLTFASGEIYANVAATQRLLDDAQVNLEQWLADRVNVEFGRQEDIAFISGDGVNKPRGLLTYVTGGASAGIHPGGNITTVNSGNASTIPNTDVLVDFTYGLSAPYRQNASWLMNSSTAATIAKMKDGQGNYIWRESLLAGQPATLLGRPVEIDEGMPAIGAGALAVAFGDFRAAYLINDRTGIRVLRDPYTNKPFVHFYATKRVGGGLLDPNAVRLLKISA